MGERSQSDALETSPPRLDRRSGGRSEGTGTSGDGAGTDLGRSGKRILIVRPSALGDIARTVPALVTLRSAHPDAHIDWLVRDSFADVIRHHPDVDGIRLFPRKLFAKIVWNPKALVAFRKWVGGLKRSQYDMVFDLQGLFRSGYFTKLTKAPIRVGYANARELGYLGYNHRHHVDRHLHSVDRMLSLLSAEGYALEHDLTLHTGASDDAWLERFRSASGIGDDSYVCLAPTARWRCKCWPTDRYAALARRLLESEHLGRHVVLLAAPDEHDQVKPMVDALQDIFPKRVHLPTTTIGQWMALISQSEGVISNDSAALHVAAGFDRPLLGIFGPTDPKLVGPYRRDADIVQPADFDPTQVVSYRKLRDDQSLISRIDVDDVWARVQKLAPTLPPADSPPTEKASPGAASPKANQPDRPVKQAAGPS